jgi:glutamate N-acetyltransferase/amino-acid N-acetyltransferase
VPSRDDTASTLLPAGFRAHTGPAGLREEGDDVAIVVAQPGSTSAGMFTRSRFAGASVELSRPRAASGRARAFVVVAKNANVATGPQGRADAAELGELAARAAGVDPSEVLVASTGVIGRPYPMDVLRGFFAGVGAVGAGGAGAAGGGAAGAGAAGGGAAGGGAGAAGGGAGAAGGGGWAADALDVARAMMTTDTHPKVAERRVGAARVVGVAKGVGMIEPDMATMLAFVLTDAAVDATTLAALWRRCVDETFNCLSVDTDTSTSDTAVVIASGAAGPVPDADLAVALREVCLDLTLQLARDGEGATKLLTVSVHQARDRDQARRVAKAILNSPLVKTAVHGADPNWGRVAMAIGKCSDDVDIDQERVVIRFGDLEAYPALPGQDGLDQLAKVMAGDHVDIDVDLGVETPDGPGAGEATVYGCDLSDGYVRINADYTT